MIVLQLVCRDLARLAAAGTARCGAIRRCDPAADREGVIRLAAASAAGSSQAGFSPSAAGLFQDLVSRSGRDVTAWVAFGAPPGDADRIVGYASLVVTGGGRPDRWAIGGLLVDPGIRRRGVGRGLVAAAAACALAAGAGEMWAETRADWTAAVAFWRAAGFRPPDADRRLVC
ncbi:MAG: GNAT family N-acetyltransferase [Planctomycetia bacterium]